MQGKTVGVVSYPIIPELRELRQEDREFKANLEQGPAKKEAKGCWRRPGEGKEERKREEKIE